MCGGVCAHVWQQRDISLMHDQDLAKFKDSGHLFLLPSHVLCCICVLEHAACCCVYTLLVAQAFVCCLKMSQNTSSAWTYKTSGDDVLGVTVSTFWHTFKDLLFLVSCITWGCVSGLSSTSYCQYLICLEPQPVQPDSCGQLPFLVFHPLEPQNGPSWGRGVVVVWVCYAPVPCLMTSCWAAAPGGSLLLNLDMKIPIVCLYKPL